MCQCAPSKYGTIFSFTYAITSLWWPWNTTFPSHSKQIYLDVILIGEGSIVIHGFQNHNNNVVWNYNHFNFLKSEQNWNEPPIFHHTNMNINPLLVINGVHLIYTYKNKIIFCNNIFSFSFRKNRIMDGFNDSATTCV